ncbi:MAG: hypothetical protein HRU33_22300 [Rhodobacteraceae bacterium]|nr:hypothetical protein [Paracoccaceae bacterium]
MEDRIRAALVTFMHWAYRRGHASSNVGASVQKAGKEYARQCTPSPEEVREMWAATNETGNLWGPYFRLCILTGQRSRSDVLKMKWDWIDLKKCRYEVPSPKNGKPHVVHLCDVALLELSIIKTLQESKSKPNEKVRGKQDGTVRH